MKISAIIVLFCAASVAAAVPADTPATTTATATTTTTRSQRESAQQSLIIAQPDAAAIHNMADGALHSQSSDRWLGPLVGLKSFTEDVGATRLTLRSRSKARNEGALGQAPWYGMAFGLACTTLAALMLG